MTKALNAPREVMDRSMETALSYGLKPTTERLVRLYEEVIAAKKEEKR